jgi:dipeptidyl aminopeptidase/acylaminoacyl peptidase
MTLASLTHYSDKLRCGIDMFGIANFVTWLKNTEDYALNFYRTEFGDERDPKMRAFLESISPVNHADNIKVPLFVFQGKNDPRVPVSESRQIVDKVRAQGGEVWYIEAANEGHGFSKPQNGFYVGAAAFAFLRKHLLEKD